MPRSTTRTARRRIPKALAVAVLILAAGLGTGTAAAAETDNMYPTQFTPDHCHDDPDGGDGEVSCQSDNAALTHYMDSKGEYELEQPDRLAVQESMNLDYDPTDFTVRYDSDPVFEGGAETDIIYQEGSTNLPPTSSGVTWCNDAVDLLRCDQQYVRIRGNGHYERGLVCHETGHAVGLLHGDVSDPKVPLTDVKKIGCMVTPNSFDEPLGPNNRENIDLTY